MLISSRRRSSSFVMGLLSLSLSFAFCQEPDVVQLGQLLNHPKKEQRREAAYQLLQLGEASAPAVRQLVRAMDDDDDQVWARAVMTLGAIGPKATFAVPALIEGMGGDGRYAEQHRQRCSFALSRIGVAAKPALLKALFDDNKHRRWGATHALALMAESASDCAADVMTLLADADDAVRHEAIDALLAFGTTSVPLLIEHLSVASEPSEQRATIEALAVFGDSAADARLPLLALLDAGPAPDVSGAALEALVQIGLDHELLVPMLVDAMLEKDDALRVRALSAILSLTEPGIRVVPNLAALMLDQDREVRRLATDTLRRFGADAATAAHVVIDRMVTSDGLDGEERGWLLETLIAMGPEVIPDVLAQVATIPLEELDQSHWAVRCLQAVGVYDAAALQEALASSESSVRYAALESIPELRHRNPGVQASVRNALQDPAARLRAAALRALARTHVPPQVWVAAIKSGMIDDDPRVRAATIASLPASPLSNNKRLAVVKDLFQDTDNEVRREAVIEVGRLGEDAQSLVPDLIAVLQRESDHVEGVLNALSTMNDKAAPSVATLTAMLETQALDRKVQILKTLQSIGEEARQALPAIGNLLQSEDLTVKVAALRAFGEVETDPDKLTAVFINALKDPSEELLQPAIQGFGRLGKRATGAVTELVTLLDSEATANAALEALRQIRFRDVDVYIKILKRPDAGARMFACERLGRLGNLAEEALPALREVAENDERSYVRRRAKDAVRRVEDKG